MSQSLSNSLFMYVVNCQHPSHPFCAFLHRNPWPWTELLDKIASHYELDNVNQFVQVFATIDVDGGGTLDQDEVYDALQEAGVKITEEGVATLFNMIDEDGSGEIDQDEWREAVDFYLELKKEEKERARVEVENDSMTRENLRKKKLAQLGESAKAVQKKKGLGIMSVLSQSAANLKKLGSKTEGEADSVSPPPSRTVQFKEGEDGDTIGPLDQSNYSELSGAPLTF